MNENLNLIICSIYILLMTIIFPFTILFVYDSSWGMILLPFVLFVFPLYDGLENLKVNT